MSVDNQDSRYIQLAIKLAKKSNPSPNPKVGAVIVKDGKVVAKGYHKKAGGPHAEATVINSVRDKSLLKGATLYVTLEPCSHEHKRTPPCANKIMESGISKVVIGCMDENPLVHGVEELKKNSISLTLLNDSECIRLNEGFFYWIKHNRPFVLLKLAMTLDGRIATKSGDSKYISNEQSRTIGYSWRTQYDSILVGVNTVLIDNPRLTSRLKGYPNPARIVIDSYLRLPVDSNFIAPNARRIVATSSQHDKEKKKKLEELGIEVLILPEKEKGHIDLDALFIKLGELGITSILVEGGGETATTLLENNLINKCAFFIAGQILGNGRNAFEGKGAEKMADAWKLRDISIRKIQDNVLVEGYLINPKP